MSLARVLGGLGLVAPQPHSGVAAPAGQVLTVGGEGHRQHGLGVPWDGGGASRDGSHAEQRLWLVHDAEHLLHGCFPRAQVVSQLPHDLGIGSVECEGHLFWGQGLGFEVQVSGFRV